MPSAQAPVSLEFTDQDVRMVTINGTSQNSWAAFPKWRELKTAFIIYCSASIFYLVPKRAFATGEEEQFRNLVASKIPKKV